MPVLRCPHCGGVDTIPGILVGGALSPRYYCNCGAYMEHVRSAREAKAAFGKALAAIDFPADDEVFVTADEP